MEAQASAGSELRAAAQGADSRHPRFDRGADRRQEEGAAPREGPWERLPLEADILRDRRRGRERHGRQLHYGGEGHDLLCADLVLLVAVSLPGD